MMNSFITLGVLLVAVLWATLQYGRVWWKRWGEQYIKTAETFRKQVSQSFILFLFFSKEGKWKLGLGLVAIVLGGGCTVGFTEAIKTFLDALTSTNGRVEALPTLGLALIYYTGAMFFNAAQKDLSADAIFVAGTRLRLHVMEDVLERLPVRAKGVKTLIESALTTIPEQLSEGFQRLWEEAANLGAVVVEVWLAVSLVGYWELWLLLPMLLLLLLIVPLLPSRVPMLEKLRSNTSSANRLLRRLAAVFGRLFLQVYPTRHLYQWLQRKWQTQRQLQRRERRFEMVLTGTLKVLLMMLVGGVLIAAVPSVSAGTGAALYNLLQNFLETVIALLSGALAILNMQPYVERLHEMLHRKDLQDSLENPVPPPTRPLILEVDVEIVSYHPLRPQKKVKCFVKFNWKEGVYVLLGPAGVGKTTLVDFIAKFRSPQGGEVLVNGIPLSDYERKDIVTLAEGEALAAYPAYEGTLRDWLLTGWYVDMEDITAKARWERYVAGLLMMYGLEEWVEGQVKGLDTELTGRHPVTGFSIDIRAAFMCVVMHMQSAACGGGPRICIFDGVGPLVSQLSDTSVFAHAIKTLQRSGRHIVVLTDERPASYLRDLAGLRVLLMARIKENGKAVCRTREGNLDDVESFPEFLEMYPKG